MESAFYNHPAIDRPIFDIADAGPIAGMRFHYQASGR